jgi:carboxylesterase
MKRTATYLLAAAAVYSAVRWLLRLRPLNEEIEPRPALDYWGALAQVAGLQSGDTERINPLCRTRLLTHGRQTEMAVGLLHGYTNCPAQFGSFADQLFARGYNVLIPRLPQHGLQDRLAPDFGRITAEQMVAVAHETVNALHGLGRRHVLIGFSAGGLLAAWAAQHRADLDHVVLVAPAVALHGIPLSRRRLYANLLITLPNQFRWWDPVNKDRLLGPPQAYPGFSTRAVGQLARLMTLVDAHAHQQPYAARRVTVITNPCDETVDNRGVGRLVKNWRSLGAPVTTYEIPPSWKQIHDMFDPAQQAQQIEKVYPQLIKWIFDE